MLRLVVAILAVAAVCTACHHGSNDVVVTPGGRKGWTISCDRLERCYKVASHDCPTGYHFVNGDEGQADRESESRAMVDRSGGFAKSHEGTHHTWLIECNP
jgi:hypothetical protein